jgi:uncharacterized protein YjbI with pentapeptide repeats
LLGAGSAYLQFSQQQRASDLQFTQQQRASHDLLISNQVSKGFEQLGSEKVVIRLAGIYALEGVMNNSVQYHQAVLEALTAFVREGAKPPTTPPTLGLEAQRPPTDIQAALTVIGRRSAQFDLIDLSNANMASADLSYANLSGANLAYANLSYAYLSPANLSRASLLFANLSSADLSDAALFEANLSHADLTHARIGQKQLDEACGSDAKLPLGLALKPCPPKSPP